MDKMTNASHFQILGLDHVVLRVTDLERAKHFYCDVLSCTIDRFREDLGLLQLRAGRSLIDLVDVNGTLGVRGGTVPQRDAPNMDHFCLRIEPFEEAAIRLHLETHGVEIGESGVRYGADGNGPSLYIQDPDGNTVELKGPPEDVSA
jgi:catechol 2,3-dioxygenase-like lactoylglutathione lyase family enzyme